MSVWYLVPGERAVTAASGARATLTARSTGVADSYRAFGGAEGVSSGSGAGG